MIEPTEGRFPFRMIRRGKNLCPSVRKAVDSVVSVKAELLHPNRGPLIPQLLQPRLPRLVPNSVAPRQPGLPRFHRPFLPDAGWLLRLVDAPPLRFQQIAFMVKEDELRLGVRAVQQDLGEIIAEAGDEALVLDAVKMVLVTRHH